jgi:bifunctional non-homologous end joining protein LigD
MKADAKREAQREAQREAALRTYRAKRRFDETSEPAGADARAGARFVVQKHEATRLHYDFRLELDGVLLSWAVTKGPSYDTKIRRLAVRTEDHPLEYGDFEGTIPAHNYGGGTVMLWDRGIWTPTLDPHQGLRDGKLAFVLHGERMRGHWALVRLRADRENPKSKRENWLLLKEKDEFANTNEDLLEAASSVASGRSMAQIAHGETARDDMAAGDVPDFEAPMLASLVEEVPTGEDYAFEIKYDGYRALIAAHGRRVKIYTRSGLDWTARFAAVADAVAARGFDRVLIDAEIVVLDQAGRSDFGALVNQLESGKGALSCFAFDLLAQGGRDWRDERLADRQAALRALIGKTQARDVLQRSETFTGDGAALLRTACERGLEGIIAKRLDAPYRAGRGHDWVKIKCGHEGEFITIGFAASAARRPFASLLLANMRDGALHYAGRVGSGFNEEQLNRLAAWRDAHRETSPACDVPAPMRKGAVWVTPTLVVQVKSAGWTRDGQVRHGVFAGVREDKPADQVSPEVPVKPAGPGMKITHPERVLYPALDITKGDVAAYIETAAPFMMPDLAGRFVSLLRAPEGAVGETFFQRHPAAGFGASWLSRAFETKAGTSQTYIYCKVPQALVRAVQMGVLEFHIWGSTVKALERPDRIVFDLDPDEAVTFAAVKRGAQRVREVLGALGLESWPLLSGGKGIHVVVPVKPQHEWPAVKLFAANVAARIAADRPDEFVATMSKAKRAGRIFIDHFRNERGATAIAPYSPRARAAAGVAWPVSWDRLTRVSAADEMTIPAAAAALRAGDAGWARAPLPPQSLSKRILQVINDA